MLKYVTKRVVMALATLFFILFILFLLLSFMPGSPFNELTLTPEQIAVQEAKYGLDKPLLVRFFIYVKNMIKGDFGVSYNILPDYPVIKLIGAKFWISAKLGIIATAVGAFIGLLLGQVAAVKHNSILDTGTTFISVLGVSLPGYVFALALSYFIGYKLNLLPIVYSVKHPVSSLILPVVSMAMGPMAQIARYTRTEMLDVLGSDYMLLAKTKGLNSRILYSRHALKNGMTPVITVLGPMLVSLMSGSMVVEQIFSVPGMGSLLVSAVQVNDYNVVLGVSFLYSLMFIVCMLVVDLLYGVIDPRISITGGKGK